MTGATGFLGRHLIEALPEEEFSLTLAARNADRCRHWLASRPGTRIFETGAIENWERMDEALADASAVVHLSGLAHAAEASAESFERANAQATRRLAEQAGSSDIRLFIHMSSIAAISPNISAGTVDDTTNPEPDTDYGRSKLKAEQHVAALASGEVCALSLRPPLIVGHDARGNWASLQKLAFSSLPLPFASVRNSRSLVSIQTMTEAISQLCRQMPAGAKSGNYCLSDPEPLSLPEILTELRTGFGKAPGLLPCPPELLSALGGIVNRRRIAESLVGDLVVDASRFQSAFAFRPSVPIRKAIRMSGEAYAAQRQ